ncbi:hypothetical protein BDV96DRAFT_596502 [Lophiotrema nucula]|uniref:BTB domain-containing protein n=1 Tax=Lophiotrema nucula TaxID=690887 RepID=A0A6A5ZII3_9PLEO|nr:hypothetical protein BDV96DRAFT_596502 [Lophiotrema nucula]
MSRTFFLRNKKTKEKEEDHKRKTEPAESNNNSKHGSVAKPKHIAIQIPEQHNIHETPPNSYRRSLSPLPSTKPDLHPGEAVLSGALSAHPVKTREEIASICQRNHDHNSFPSACITLSGDGVEEVSPIKSMPSPATWSQCTGKSGPEIIGRDSFMTPHTLEARMNGGPQLPTPTTETEVPHTRASGTDSGSKHVIDSDDHLQQAVDTISSSPVESSPSSPSTDSEISISPRKDPRKSKHHLQSRHASSRRVRKHSPTPDELFLPPHDEVIEEHEKPEQTSLVEPSVADLEHKSDEGRDMGTDPLIEMNEKERVPDIICSPNEEDKEKDIATHTSIITDSTESKHTGPHLFVTIIVGTQHSSSDYLTQRMFNVHRQFLKNSKILYPLTTSPESPIINLPDVEPEAFELYLKYAGTGLYEFSKDVPHWNLKGEADKMLSWQECWPLLNAHVLSVKIRDEAFTDYIMDVLITNVNPHVCPDEATISHLFTASDVSEQLKRFVVNAYIDGREAGVGIEALENYPKIFLILALQEALARRGETPEVVEADSCRYHVHGLRGTCYIERRAKQRERKERYDRERRRGTQSSLAAVDEAAQNGVKLHDWAYRKPLPLNSISLLEAVASDPDEDYINTEMAPVSGSPQEGEQILLEEKQVDTSTATGRTRGDSLFGSENVGAVDDVLPPANTTVPAASVVSEPNSVIYEPSPTRFESFPPFVAEATPNISNIGEEHYNIPDEKVEEESVELADVLEDYKAYYQCPGAFPLVDYSPPESVRGSIG